MSGFVQRYLLAAFGLCTFCTWIVVWRCSCDPPLDGPAGPPRVVRAGLGFAQPVPAADLPETFLLIAIMSSPSEAAVRSVIRDTWLKLSAKGPTHFRHFFPLGTKNMSQTELEHVKEEKELHGDIVLLSDLAEDYSLLSKKTLATMIHAHHNYKFEYLLKVDSDSFVRVGAMLKSLRDMRHPRLYWGFLDGRAKPIRKGKWKESDWVLCDRYLPYQLGGGYVLAYQLVEFVSVNSRLFKLYKSEDVSVGAWLAGLDVKYVHDPRFDTEWTSRGCHNQYLITHKKSPQEMEKLYFNMVNYKQLCVREFRTRWSYVYDWSAPPSHCCNRVNGSVIP